MRLRASAIDQHQAVLYQATAVSMSSDSCDDAHSVRSSWPTASKVIVREDSAIPRTRIIQTMMETLATHLVDGSLSLVHCMLQKCHSV